MQIEDHARHSGTANITYSHRHLRIVWIDGEEKSTSPGRAITQAYQQRLHRPAASKSVPESRRELGSNLDLGIDACAAIAAGIVRLSLDCTVIRNSAVVPKKRLSRCAVSGASNG